MILADNKHLIFRMKVSLVLFVIVTILISYLNFSSSDEIVIDEKGNINGVQNNLRYKLRGNDFLLEQKNLVITKIEHLKKEPERHKELELSIKRIIEEANKNRLEFEIKYPSMKPSEIEIYIEDLRNRADKLENIEREKYFEELRLKSILKLELILNSLKNI